MPADTYIDEHGVIRSRREVANVAEGREVLLQEQSNRSPPELLQQEDVEAGSATSGSGFQFHGFPGFKWKSVVGVIVAAQLIMYFVSCWLVSPRQLLSPSGSAMFKIGSSNSVAEMCAIRDHFPRHLIELRRWFVPIFLHVNPMHILLNLYFECSCGPRIEARDSALAFAVLFFGAGMMGNLLSDAFGVNGVGGSTACYGIIGMDFATWWRRWPELNPEQRKGVKNGLMQTCGMLLLWEVILWKEIDHFGHLGGFIGGFLIVTGREDKRFLVPYIALAAACVWVICIRPLGRQEVNGIPWERACASVWAAYR